MRIWLAAIAVCACVAVTGLAIWTQRDQFASAPLGPERVGEIETIVRNYLLANPQVIREVFTALETHEEEERQASMLAAISENGAELFRHPDGVVLGNPDGDVTMVEFFDYNCGYCQRALSDLATLLESDPQLRVVMKEFPILTPGSLEAAKVSVAVGRQGRYWDFHRELLTTRGEANEARALAIAEKLGLDMERLRSDIADPQTQQIIEDTNKLALELGVEGTPAYFVGNKLIPGAIGVDGLRETIAQIRESGCEVC